MRTSFVLYDCLVPFIDPNKLGCPKDEECIIIHYFWPDKVCRIMETEILHIKNTEKSLFA